jgi:hypothetical protein
MRMRRSVVPVVFNARLMDRSSGERASAELSARDLSSAVLESSGKSLAETFSLLSHVTATTGLPSLPYAPEIARRAADAIVQTDYAIAKSALTFVANCFASCGPAEMQDLLRPIPVVAAVQRCAQSHGSPIYPTVLLCLANVAATSPADCSSIFCHFSLDQIRLLVSAVASNPTFRDHAANLLAAIAETEMSAPAAAAFCVAAAQMFRYIGFPALAAIGRCARWVPDFGDLADSLGIVTPCAKLMRSGDPAAIPTALLVLAHCGCELNEEIWSLALCEDDTVAASAIWFIGRHLMGGPEAFGDVMAFGAAELVWHCFAEGGMRVKVEGGLLLCRLISACPDENTDKLAQFVRYLADSIECDVEWRILLKLLDAIGRIAEMGIDVADDGIFTAVETLCNHENERVALRAANFSNFSQHWPIKRWVTQ